MVFQTEKAIKDLGDKADKKEVEQMVALSLNGQALPKLDDTVDAIAIAICHSRNCNLI